MYIYLLVYIIIVWGIVLAETTTIRVSKRTAQALENIRENLKAESLDEAIQALIKKQRKTFLEQTFGVDKGKISSFTEADRGEDRS
jgi:biopolymer transport protein ExbB/TolQ